MFFMMVLDEWGSAGAKRQKRGLPGCAACTSDTVVGVHKAALLQIDQDMIWEATGPVETRIHEHAVPRGVIPADGVMDVAREHKRR